MHVKWLIGIKTIPVKSSVIKALVYLIIYLDGSYVPFFILELDRFVHVVYVSLV